mgnify:CR=1 FL=1
MFDISVVFPYFPQLLIGVLSTLAVSLSAIVTGLILGWLICLGLNSPQRLVRCFCKIPRIKKKHAAQTTAQPNNR